MTPKGPLVVSVQILKSAPARGKDYSSDDLKALAKYVLVREKIIGDVELTLEFTHPKRIQALNRRFRGVDRTTDIIAFRYDNAKGFEGDVAINIEQARLQARRIRHPVHREVRLLFIHGILHLLGYTDYEPKPRRKMFHRQNQLLKQWEKLDG